MTQTNQVRLFAILIMCSYGIDKFLNPCPQMSAYTEINAIAHHAMSNIFFLGPFVFGHHLIHIITIVVVITGWYLNDWTCVLTDYYNDACGLPGDTRHKDLTYYFTETFSINIYLFLAIILAYDAAHIYKSTQGKKHVLF